MDLQEVAGSVHEEPSTLSSAMSLTSFTLFPEFPTELRLLIWSHCLPGPRIINVSNHIDYKRRRKQPWYFDGVRIVHPAILAVTQESRSVGLEKYAIFRFSRGHYDLAFNSEHDTVYIPRGSYLSPLRFGEGYYSTALEYGRTDEKSMKIKKLVIHGTSDAFFLGIRDCSDLEKLSIVIDRADYLFGAGQNERVMALGEQVEIPLGGANWSALPNGLNMVLADLGKLFGKGGKSEGKTLVLKLVKEFKGESAGEEFCVPLTANSLSRE